MWEKITVNINVYTKFDEILSICFEDNEWKLNSEINQVTICKILQVTILT